jgi:drug/metabolite transporter (DMT)-like permease
MESLIVHRDRSPASLVRGSLWMWVAGLLFSAMGVLVRLGAREFSSAELVFYRSLFGFAVILPPVAFGQHGVLTPYWRWHLSRSLMGTAGISLHFFVIATLPLATAVTFPIRIGLEEHLFGRHLAQPFYFARVFLDTTDIGADRPQRFENQIFNTIGPIGSPAGLAWGVYYLSNPCLAA